MARRFVHRLRVRYSECDQQGVVFNGHYLFFYDVAMTELWREAVGPWDETVAGGVDLVVAEARLRFHGGARFDELVDIALPIARLGETSMTLTPEFRVDDRTLVTGEVRHVFVDPTDRGKMPIPDEVRAALEPYVVDG